MARTSKCRSCEFWLPHEEGAFGLCVRRAPAPGPAAKGDSVVLALWPVTSPDLGCGEWDERTDHDGRPELPGGAVPPGLRQ